MTNDQIEKFIDPRHLSKNFVKIEFKTRNPINGIFIRTNDYDYLKSKNLWRIVTRTQADNWKKTGDEGLARIFNGTEITRLSQTEMIG